MPMQSRVHQDLYYGRCARMEEARERARSTQFQAWHACPHRRSTSVNKESFSRELTLLRTVIFERLKLWKYLVLCKYDLCHTNKGLDAWCHFFVALRHFASRCQSLGELTWTHKTIRHLHHTSTSCGKQYARSEN